MKELRLGICEDDSNDLNHLLSLLSTEKTTLAIETFSSAEELLSGYIPGHFDIIFMDIYMPGVPGIEAIQKVREQDTGVTIVLVSSSTDYAMEAYRLQVVRYLEKPVQSSDLHQVLQRCLLEKASKPLFHFIHDYKDQSIPLDEILYFEQSGRKLLIHRNNQPVLSINGKLDQLEWQLSDHPFFRCHKSYYVNLSHVALLESELRVFIMDNEDNVYIRRESYAKAKKAYEDFLFQNVLGR